MSLSLNTASRRIDRLKALLGFGLKFCGSGERVAEEVDEGREVYGGGDLAVDVFVGG